MRLRLVIANKNYSSWSMRPWVLMKVTGIPFEEKNHRFLPNVGGKSFADFSPTGKVPLLVEGDIVVWDSLAIVEYLAERHDVVWPKDAKARAWARSASAEMHSGFQQLRNICNMNVGIRVKLNEITDGLRSDLARMEALWHDGFTRFGSSRDEVGITSSARFIVERASASSMGLTQHSDSRVRSTNVASATLPLWRIASRRSAYAFAALESGTR